MSSYKNKSVEGQQAVDIYKGWLDNLNYLYRDATLDEQHNGWDLCIIGIGLVEIKLKKMDGAIVIEETSIGDNSPGWIYTSCAEWLVEVDSDGKRFFKIDMEQLRRFYQLIKNNYELKHNDKTTDTLYGDEWTSTYRIIPITHIMGYVDVEAVLINKEIK